MSNVRSVLSRVLWPLGPWQLLTFIACNLASFANYSLFQALAGVSPPFACRLLPSTASCLRFASPSNFSLVPCREGWRFAHRHFLHSFPQQFDLVCDRRFLVPTTAAVYFTGTIVGRLVGGLTADRCGRLRVFVAASALSFASGVGVAFAPDVTTFILLRFAVGAASNAAIVASVVLWTEISSATERATLCFVFGVLKACVVPLWTALLAFLTQDWRWLHLALSAPAALALLFPLFLVESPLWLLNRRKRTEAAAAVETAMRLNRCEERYPEQDIEELRAALKNEEEEMKEEEAVSSLQQILSCLVCSRGLGLRLLAHTFIWFVIMTEATGLNFYSVRMKGNNPYLIIALGGLFALPGLLFKQCIYSNIDRKTPLVFVFLLTASFGAGDVGLRLGGIVGLPNAVLATCAHGCTLAAMNMAYTLTAESFPKHAGWALGLASGLGRLGSILAPFVERLDEFVWPPLPMIVFVSSALLAGLMVLCMTVPGDEEEQLTVLGAKSEEEKEEERKTDCSE